MLKPIFMELLVASVSRAKNLSVSKTAARISRQTRFFSAICGLAIVFFLNPFAYSQSACSDVFAHSPLESFLETVQSDLNMNREEIRMQVAQSLRCSVSELDSITRGGQFTTVPEGASESKVGWYHIYRIYFDRGNSSRQEVIKLVPPRLERINFFSLDFERKEQLRVEARGRIEKALQDMTSEGDVSRDEVNEKLVDELHLMSIIDFVDQMYTLPSYVQTIEVMRVEKFSRRGFTTVTARLKRWREDHYDYFTLRLDHSR